MSSLVLKKFLGSFADGFKVHLNKFCTRVRTVAELPRELHSDVENDILKPRHHPGIIKNSFRTLPVEIEKSIIQVIGDTPIKQLLKDGKQLSSYLLMRHIPLEDTEISKRKTEIQREVEESIKFNKHEASEEEQKHHDEVVKSKVANIIKQRIYNWKSFDYTQHNSLAYLISRGISEFTVLTRVFKEIKKSVPDFEPRTLFDFGSGVGTVIWAAESIWPSRFDEFYCVDTSSHMCQLSSQIIELSNYVQPNKVFHRQFLPASYDRKYDIVVSAYSLMELPSLSARLQTLHNLWNKTAKYLVLVERGTNAYFKIINEARDFILMNAKQEGAEIHEAHIVAPCPHEFSCPRYQTDQTPCNFIVKYENKFQRSVDDELFTYIIIAKGKRKDLDNQWPRIIRPVLLRSRHAVCKLCTSSGRLEQITFSSTKPNKPTYRCAKASRWGDFLPVQIKYVTESKKSFFKKNVSRSEQMTQPSEAK